MGQWWVQWRCGPPDSLAVVFHGGASSSKMFVLLDIEELVATRMVVSVLDMYVSIMSIHGRKQSHSRRDKRRQRRKWKKYSNRKRERKQSCRSLSPITSAVLSVRPTVCVNVTTLPGTSAGFWLAGSMPPCRLRRIKF